ncbi:hypothetical protein [Bifidobacterium pseudocatenulatum]|uniref:hypothetical protein n=1 Tax=Bifidobacterium pseudocatenulatum TaxID=28026 RepID=UPI001CFEFFDF|nr:hypothetical protein [Bifidobacterium pseudocatenulatum]MCB4907603.1 hypothetical protein [Bifidobacterium pseudocatenulatum]
MALTPFDMEGVNRDLLAAGNPAKPDMQSILRRNARDLVWGHAILASSVDAKELEFGVHMAYSDADGGFDTDPSEDVWFEASSLPIPNERPDLPPDNALRIRVTDVLTEYGFTDIDVKAPDRTPEGIWIGFEAMQPVRLDVTSAQEGRSVSLTLTAAEANDWRSGRLDAHGLSRMAVERVLARPGDTVTLAYGDPWYRPAVMCDGSGKPPEHRVKAGIGTFVIGRESEAVMPEILRIDRTVDPRDPLVIEKAFGKENDMENGNVPEYWKGLMDEADLPLAGIVREHGGGLMDFHRMKGIERLTGSSDWDFYSDIKFTATGSPDGRKVLEVSVPGSARHALITAKPGAFDVSLHDERGIVSGESFPYEANDSWTYRLSGQALRGALDLAVGWADPQETSPETAGLDLALDDGMETTHGH